MKFEKTFGETVKKLREEKNLPLREVAQVLRIDTSMLGKIEKNNRKPSKLIIEKFAKFFNVSDKDLIVAHLSDEIVYQVMEQEGLSDKVLKVTEEKVKYLKTKKLRN